MVRGFRDFIGFSPLRPSGGARGTVWGRLSEARLPADTLLPLSILPEARKPEKPGNSRGVSEGLKKCTLYLFGKATLHFTYQTQLV